MSIVILNTRFPELASKKMRQHLPDIGRVVAERAQGFCVVRTGALRRSIGSYETLDGVSVGSDLPYAGVIEYGTMRRAPQPYLRPALDTLRINPPHLQPK